MVVVIPAILAVSTAAEIALLITAIGGFITGVAGLIVGWRGQTRNEKSSQLALLLEGYDEIVANLHTEIARLVADLNIAREELGKCKALCSECEAGMLKLERTIERLEHQLRIEKGKR